MPRNRTHIKDCSDNGVHAPGVLDHPGEGLSPVLGNSVNHRSTGYPSVSSTSMVHFQDAPHLAYKTEEMPTLHGLSCAVTKTFSAQGVWISQDLQIPLNVGIRPPMELHCGSVGR